MASLEEIYQALLSQVQGLRAEQDPSVWGYAAQGDAMIPSGDTSTFMGFNGASQIDRQLRLAKAQQSGVFNPDIPAPYQPNDFIPKGAYVGIGDMIGQANFDYQPTAANSYIGNPATLRPDLMGINPMSAIERALRSFSK